jgi:hypothetical protein
MTRPLALLLALACALGALLPTAAPLRAGSHVAFLPAVRTPGDPPVFGVVFPGAVDASTGLETMRAAGIAWAAVNLDWREIEPVAGHFDWTATDARLGNASAAGLRVYVLFYGDPAWAWLPDGSATVPETRLAFVRRMVERYDCDGTDDAPVRACVDDWSFYPEPDCFRAGAARSPGAKGYWGRRGADYADMIAAVARVAREQNPRARIYIGGLAYDWFDDKGGPFVRAFLPDVLARLNNAHGGATTVLSGLTFHFYPLTYTSIRDKAAALQRVLRQYGAADLPLLVPEGGYWSAPAAGSSEAKQAEWLAQQYVRAIAVGIRQFAWLGVFDDGPGSETHGLFRGRDLTQPKPAYTAYHILTRELAGAAYAGGTTLGVERYTFAMPDGQTKTVVLGGSGGGLLALPGGCVRTADALGGTLLIRDGDRHDRDDRADGRVTLGVPTHGILYVTAC